MKVMIVEDEILVRLGLRKAIPWSSLGMELVCEAQDGAEAYELFKQHLPDIVLVDIELPKMDGLKFIRYAKSHRADARFIVLTCHQDMKYMREAIQLQVNDFILKSTLDMAELCHILQSLSFDIDRTRAEAKKAQPLGFNPELQDRTEVAATAELAYYALDISSRSVDAYPLQEVLSDAVQKLKKDIYSCIESLQLGAAKQQLQALQAELQRTPRLHPNIVKNMLTEFLFRSWSACEELTSGKQAVNHQLVDRIYMTRKLEETVSLLLEEMNRLEGQLALTHSAEDKAKVIVLIKQYIKTHLEQEISLHEIANAFYINRNYLSRLFKEVSQMSFTEYVLHEKTELAIVMMKSGQSLTEISERLGYLNLSSFTRMFKKVRGVSPSRYLEDKSQGIIG